VNGPHDAVVAVGVQHWDSDAGIRSDAGSLTMVAPGELAFLASGLKEELRFKFTVVGDAGGDPVQVRILPPEWLPC